MSIVVRKWLINIRVLFLLFGCLLLSNSILNAQNKATVKPATDSHGKIVYGVASFYSKSLQGSETSTGEFLDQAKMTAASNFYKLNTWIRVTNLSNNKTIIVRVNDRMHQRMADRGRVIDVTRGGAIALGFVSRGLTRVMLEEVPPNTKE
ncbi:MAG: septal ring lytic transglycosylase RlpA family lipoprotein [Pseudopedobacter saltans]|uniref:Septal ring lytic transglycosylase RlpA family lipoprotein n=1 Tax=Pseudopedobacter saltans TaxID=151895 RepID=A0A2W5FD83_9SPHI|nr:MAG: septal ring lytic transglycosylase RlpA family lipoprotein [Pseudopedobacter saltans]